MPTHKHDLKRHIPDMMIVSFFIVILATIINCDETSDNKYINKLPDNDKKAFLDNVARRILEEVPDVKSIETSAANGGDVLEEKLKTQSDFVQKILQQEVESLKTKRRNDLKIKHNNNITNETDLKLDTNGSTAINQSEPVVSNNTRKTDAEEARTGSNNTSHENTEHIDLTFRAHENQENKYGEKNRKKNTAESGKAENYEQFVPVKIKYDEDEVLPVQKKTNQGGNRKREIVPESKENISVASAVSLQNKTRRRSDTIGDVLTTKSVNKTTIDAKIINTEILDKVEVTTDITTVKINVSNILTESTKKPEPVIEPVTQRYNSKPVARIQNKSDESESSEFLSEHINVEIKTEETVEKKPINTNITVTSNEPNLNITNMPVSKNPNDVMTTITSLTTEASTSTTKTVSSTTETVQANRKNVTIMRDGDNADNNTAYSTSSGEAITTTERLSGVTPIPKKCDDKPCNQSNKENKTVEPSIEIHTTTSKETVATVTTSKKFLIPNRLTKKPGAINVSTSTKIIKNLKNALSGFQHKERNHSPKDLHFGDLQVPTTYEVFEVDPKKPAFKAQKLNTEPIQYVPVHIYDKEHAFYNPQNRYAPNPSVPTDTVEIRSISETIEETIEDEEIETIKDGKRMVKIIHEYENRTHTQSPYRKRPRLQQLPDTGEDEHPFQVHQKGLKDSLKAVRGILYTNTMFGYVPTNLEREVRLNSSCIFAPRTYKTKLLTNFFKIPLRCRRQENRNDYENTASENISNERVKRPKPLDLGQESSISDMSYNIHRNTITVNGVTYNIYDDNKLGSLFRPEDASKDDSSEDEKVVNWLKNRKHKRKTIHKESVYVNDDKNTRLADVIRVLKMVNKWQSNENPDEAKYLRSIVKSVRSRSDEGNVEKETHFAPIQQKLPLRVGIEEKSDFNKNINRKEKLKDRSSDKEAQRVRLTVIPDHDDDAKIDTIQKIISITPAIDALENIDKMLDANIKIMRTNDEEDLELHVNILKDLVKMDNSGLKRFDWLGSTVDIQAALRKLMDLTERRMHHKFIHRSDLNLLKYIQEIYKKASVFFLEREKEQKQDQEKESRILNSDKNARSFSKTGKHIRNPLRLLDHIWDMHDHRLIHREIFRKLDKKGMPSTLSIDEEFLIFLYTIQIRLQDFHEAIKQIATITKYDSQRWYRNIKDLYLSAGKRKEYLQVLLHLFLTRFLDLTEENVMMGANKDYKKFMVNMRTEVDRAEVELVFILKVLTGIKQLK